ncbi:MAG: Xaa-Pro dipeptidase [Planctomycetota bacterium]
MSDPDWKGLFAAHLARAVSATQAALAACELPGVVVHAGRELHYHADDQEVPFHTVPHFARFAPIPGPEHLLLVPRVGAPRLLRVVARDFWVEPPASPPAWVTDALPTEEVSSAHQARQVCGQRPGWAYLGNDPAAAVALGAVVEPPALVQRLDWERAYKSDYEVACLREAACLAAIGHTVVREGAARGATEHELHLAYLEATGLLGRSTPYENIVAWDRHAAVLHYPHKRREPPRPGRTFLIDAGATCHGYASDITRTWLLEGSHPVFRALFEGMVRLQDELVEAVAPGLEYVALHQRAFRGVTELLCAQGLLRVSADEAYDRRLAFPFFPHGLGHHLGIQVHDVGGKLRGPVGDPVPPPEDFPWLRTTRALEVGHVVTIEPGLYFIPLLLDGYRKGADVAAFDWGTIDGLLDSGGIRIEDDVLVTASGRENLSRPYLPVC